MWGKVRKRSRKSDKEGASNRGGEELKKGLIEWKRLNKKNC
jgi:hypothetical protein